MVPSAILWVGPDGVIPPTLLEFLCRHDLVSAISLVEQIPQNGEV